MTMAEIKKAIDEFERAVRRVQEFHDMYPPSAKEVWKNRFTNMTEARTKLIELIRKEVTQ